MNTGYFFRFCTGRARGDLQVRGEIGGLKCGSSFLCFSFEIMQIDSGFPFS